MSLPSAHFEPTRLEAKPAKVWLFATCLGDLFYPEILESMVRILNRLGIRVEFPAEQTCCGQPALNSGFFDEARDVAAHTIKTFEGADLIVSPSGSCTAIVREHYPKLFKDHPTLAEPARQIANRTFEFVEFLQKKLCVDWSGYNLSYPATSTTYHYSCHHREIDMSEHETPRLLAQISGIDYRPLPNIEECCGFGGTFAVKCSEISGAMVSDKVEAIRQTGAELLICNDAGCTMNIAGAARRQGFDIDIKHMAILLDEAMTNGRKDVNA